jgi:hypothetical protein
MAPARKPARFVGVNRPAAAFVLFVAVAAGSCYQPRANPFPQANACRVALGCYFGNDNHDLSKQASGDFTALADHGLFEDTYGPNGLCWNDDGVLARACEERCRGMIWQDCNLSYNGTNQPPFCTELDGVALDVCADDFREACERERKEDDAGFVGSVCPSGDSKAGIKDSFCTVDEAEEQDGVQRGCCSINDRPVHAHDCIYDYEPDDAGKISGPRTDLPKLHQ